jgi:environmental stress-induced protein Ves
LFRSGVKRKQCQKITRWAGGCTRQLAIYPRDAQGSEAFDFVFEITSSTTDIKESEYTIYESYNRTLMIISGELILTLEDGDTYSLSPYGQCTFDGALRALSRGRAVDYEMTLRKGRSGRVEFLGRVSDLSIKASPGYLGLYCLKGSLRIYSKEFRLEGSYAVK